MAGSQTGNAGCAILGAVFVAEDLDTFAGLRIKFIKLQKRHRFHGFHSPKAIKPAKSVLPDNPSAAGRAVESMAFLSI
jgi:hypothetical protein